MEDAPREVQEMFARILGDMEQERLERARDAAKADPKAHRNSSVFEEEMKPRYYGPLRYADGTHVYYAYTLGRNVAGYYMTYREVQQPPRDDGSRFVRQLDPVGHKKRREAKAHALDCYTRAQHAQVDAREAAK